jgi:methanogenic corrinoid protein MtbC1
VEPHADNATTRAARELRDRLEERLRANDRPGAVRSAVEAVTEGRVDIVTLYRDVLTPLLVDTGSAWQSGQVAVWQEHLASATVRTIVEGLYPEVLKVRAAATPVGRKVLLACPSQETHDLGLRMVSDRFDMAGWTTYFLGADTPVSQIVEAARGLDVDAIVVSSSTHFHRVALRTFLDQLRRDLPGVRLWIGGAAFARDRDWPADELVDLEQVLAPASGQGETGHPGDV